MAPNLRTFLDMIEADPICAGSVEECDELLWLVTTGRIQPDLLVGGKAKPLDQVANRSMKRVVWHYILSCTSSPWL